MDLQDNVHNIPTYYKRWAFSGRGFEFAMAPTTKS